MFNCGSVATSKIRLFERKCSENSNKSRKFIVGRCAIGPVEVGGWFEVFENISI